MECMESGITQSVSYENEILGWPANSNASKRYEV